VHLYYTGLLMDAGCTAWTSQLAGFLAGEEIEARRDLLFFTDRRHPLEMLRWLGRYVAPSAPVPARALRAFGMVREGDDFVREGFRNTCEVAGRLAHRLGMPPEVEAGLVAAFERWDGRGPAAMQGAAIPLVSRIVYLTGYLEVFHRASGRDAARSVARARRGKAFDPAVVDAFLAISDGDAFWAPLESGPAWDLVLALEPDSALRTIDEARVAEVALAFADFADMKSPQTYGHSRRVGDLADRAATAAGLSPADAATVRTAALMHDLGQVAVPSFLIEKPDAQLSRAEREQRKLHAHHSELVISSIAGFEEVARLAGAHHERMDGGGYPSGARASTLPLGARLIAAASRFDEIAHPGDGSPGFSPGEAIEAMRSDTPAGICPEAFAALVEAVRDGPVRPPPSRAGRPAGLTEREVEVLRLVSRGLRRREIAGALTVSEATVRHHLEHIYAKIGVSTRVAAALFAVEHHLID
jgi:HD-GYP domain-containing protein (c-di-GMP phosphodiesterase class II)